jgi:hypothetical protein
LPSGNRLPIGTLVFNLAMHFWSDFLWPTVEFKSDGLYFKGRLLGDREAITKVRSEASYLNVQHQFEPLFQHYGWPTTWLDVTYDPRTAIFFASYDFAEKRFTTTGNGYVYFWEAYLLGKRFPSLDVVDLKHLASAIAKALEVAATRPSRQSAASMKIGHGLGGDLLGEDGDLASARTCIAFDRHDVQDIAYGYEYYFPNDPLKDLLTAFQRKYLRWAGAYNKDKDPSHLIGFVDDWNRFARRDASLEDDSWRALGYDPALVERFYDCAFGLAYHRQIVSAVPELSSRFENLSSLKYEQLDELLRTLTGERLFNN